MSIYLDYAATTPVDRRVLHKMIQFLTIEGLFANPASHSHQLGRKADGAVNWARRQVAESIGASDKEIIWTSGATESNNLAIKGVAQHNHKQGKHIITAKTEHRAVLDVCAFLVGEGFEVTYLDPNSDGVITAESVSAAMRDDTLLVSIMYANNETGVINDIASIGKMTREKNVIFHVDGAQAVGKTPIAVDEDNIDLLSMTAHKLYGPKGVGALYVRRKPRVRLQAQMHGGGHERGLRSGTLATQQIIGMGEAYRLANKEMENDAQHRKALSDLLWQGLNDIPGIALNAMNAMRLDNILSVRFDGVDSAKLTNILAKELAISSGSACTSATAEPSHVLTAMGLTNEQALSTLRLSLGRFTTASDIEKGVDLIYQAMETVRNV